MAAGHRLARPAHSTHWLSDRSRLKSPTLDAGSAGGKPNMRVDERRSMACGAKNCLFSPYLPASFADGSVSISRPSVTKAFSKATVAKPVPNSR